MKAQDAVVTLWFVNTTDPAEVLKKEPKADRGFGRKYLAQLNPTWPIAVFGQFPLNRSVQASRGEFYIAGYPGVSVVQTVVENMTMLSKLDKRLLRSLSATNVYAFATNSETGWGGIAHWVDGQIKRSFCARRDRVYEDIGLPEPFENPFWAGERDSVDENPRTAIDLPFAPIDLVHEADQHWLGIDISAEGPDLSVVGYAIDGRKEPKIAEAPRRKSVSDMVDSASSKLGLGPQHSNYDDYEDLPEFNDRPDLSARARRIADLTLGFSGRTLRRAGQGFDAIREKLRHTDR